MKAQLLLLGGSALFAAAALAQNAPAPQSGSSSDRSIQQSVQPATPQRYEGEPGTGMTSGGGLPMTGRQASGSEATGGKTRAQVVDELLRAEKSGEIRRLRSIYEGEWYRN